MEKKEKEDFIIENVEYGEEDLSEIIAIQFIRWANEYKNANLVLIS